MVVDGRTGSSRYLGVLSVFDCVVSGVVVKRKDIPPKKDYGKLDHLNKRCLGALNEDATAFPDFVSWCSLSHSL